MCFTHVCIIRPILFRKKPQNTLYLEFEFIFLIISASCCNDFCKVAHDTIWLPFYFFIGNLNVIVH